VSRRLRWLASLLNPFQPIRGDFTNAVFVTVLAAWFLGSGIYGGHPGTIAVGAAESLWCPVGPAVCMLYRCVRR
jgi:hypothetical protein